MNFTFHYDFSVLLRIGSHFIHHSLYLVSLSGLIQWLNSSYPSFVTFDLLLSIPGVPEYALYGIVQLPKTTQPQVIDSTRKRDTDSKILRNTLL